MKKILLVIILSLVCFAQSPAKKWVIIQDLQDRIVYLDTTAIKVYENQISLWGLTKFREPQRFTPFQDEVYQIKSNLLFNDVTRTYNVIGTLYYDKTLRIIGESTSPRITGGEDTFELPVQPGSSIEALFKSAKNYVTEGTINVPESEYLVDNEMSKQKPKMNSDTTNPGIDSLQANQGPIKLSLEENIAVIDEANVKTFEKQDTVSIKDTVVQPTKTEQILDRVNQPASELKPPSNKANLDNVKVDVPEPKPSKPKYDASQDRNVQGNYWSDGNLFVIQLSSWRQKNVAEQIVAEKKSEGHNAFLMQVDLPGRGTWYRVRIGYFDTLGEARNYRRTNNL